MGSFFMDSFTQIVLGVAVAHIGLGNRENWKKTVVLGAILGTLPDLDFIVAKCFNDPLTVSEIHRGFSHSFLFFSVISFFISFFIKKWFKLVSKKRLLFTVFFILFTHALLDSFTGWGTQILWPYPTKFALKSIFVVDIAYTIPLTIGVIAGVKNKNVFFTSIGLVISAMYLIWGIIAQSVVKKDVVHIFNRKHKEIIKTHTVKPTFSNSILWNSIIETETGYYISDKKLFDNDEIIFHYFPHNRALIAGIADENILRLKNISEQQYIITENRDGLVFNDLRFGLLKSNDDDIQFAFSYQLIPNADGFSVKEIPKDKRDGLQLLKNTWNRIIE